MQVWLLEISSNNRDTFSLYRVQSLWEVWPTIEQVIQYYENITKEPGDYGLVLDALRETQEWPSFQTGRSHTSFPISPPTNPYCKDPHWNVRLTLMQVHKS